MSPDARANAERRGTRTPPLRKPDALALARGWLATGATPATAETARLAIVQGCG